MVGDTSSNEAFSEGVNAVKISKGSVLENLSTKEEIINKFRVHDADVGSPEVQIALLTKRLDTLSHHFAKNKQDKHSMRGLLKMVSQRRRLLQYLMNEDVNRYRGVLSALNLRK